MLDFLFAVLAALRVFVRSRSDIALEVLALRQQVAVLKRQRPRPTLTRLDRFFWTIASEPAAGDIIIIPPNTPHYFSEIGSAELVYIMDRIDTERYLQLIT